VISRKWSFGIFAALLAILVTIILYRAGQYLKRIHNNMKLLVKEREKEIELLTDLWKIDETEIEWVEHISQGISVNSLYDYLTQCQPCQLSRWIRRSLEVRVERTCRSSQKVVEPLDRRGLQQEVSRRD